MLQIFKRPNFILICHPLGATLKLTQMQIDYLSSLVLPLVQHNVTFFLIGKDNSLRAKRLEKGYTRSIARNKEAKNKKINKSDPYLVASQSTKSIKERVRSSIYTLTQFTEVYKKMNLISWSFLSISSKVLLFLSFQMVHIRQRGQLSKLSPFSCPRKIHAILGGSFSQRSASPIAPQKGRRSEAITFWPSHKTREGDLWLPPHICTKSTYWGCSNQISSGSQW